MKNKKFVILLAMMLGSSFSACPHLNTLRWFPQCSLFSVSGSYGELQSALYEIWECENHELKAKMSETERSLIEQASLKDQIAVLNKKIRNPDRRKELELS